MTGHVPATAFEPGQLAGVWFLIASTHDFWRHKSHATADFERDGDGLRSGLRFKQRNLFGTPSVREVWGLDRFIDPPGSFAWEGQGSVAEWSVPCVGPRGAWHVAHARHHKLGDGPAVEIFARGPTLPQAEIDRIGEAIRAVGPLRAAAIGIVAVNHDHRPPSPYRFGL